MTIADKRKKIEAYVLKLMKIDPSGINYERYKNMFKGMSDTQFKAWIEDIRAKRDQLFVYAPNLKNSINATVAKKFNEFTNTNLYERLYIKDKESGKVFLTPHTYFIIPLSIRRVKQFLMDKMSVPEHDRKTDMLTGQVIRESKGSSVSHIQMQTIADKGLEKSVVELLKVRGGDIHAYSEYKQRLIETGEVALNEMNLGESTTRSVVISNVYLKGMHIDNNL